MTTTLFASFAKTKVGHVHNPQHSASVPPARLPDALFQENDLNSVRQQISAWPGYRPSPLHRLQGLAARLGVAGIRYKDESDRFGLGSFKALGGAYAVSQVAANVATPAGMTIATATDGNHGLSVAWGAKNYGMKAVVYIHAEVSQGREQALIDLGAEVVRIDGNYDESVRLCYQTAQQHDWTVISDTTSEGRGKTMARTVMLGYSVMVSEIVNELQGDLPTHVFVQGGVGGLAASVCETFRLAYGDGRPKFIVVEPELAPCLFLSAKNQTPTVAEIVNETVMAGLSCGEVSAVAWPVLHHYADHFLTISDALVAPTMQLLANPQSGDMAIVAGESAVAGLAACIAATHNHALSVALNLDEHSRVLVIGTEGATDPALYEEMTGQTAQSVLRANI